MTSNSPFNVDTPTEEKVQHLALETNEFKIIYRDLQYFLRRLVSRFLPARAPQDYDNVDLVTGLHIRVKTSPFYVTLSVNERDFYWNRWSGKFDGTGSSFMYEHPGVPTFSENPLAQAEYDIIKDVMSGQSLEK